MRGKSRAGSAIVRVARSWPDSAPIDGCLRVPSFHLINIQPERQHTRGHLASEHHCRWPNGSIRWGLVTPRLSSVRLLCHCTVGWRKEVSRFHPLTCCRLAQAKVATLSAGPQRDGSETRVPCGRRDGRPWRTVYGTEQRSRARPRRVTWKRGYMHRLNKVETGVYLSRAGWVAER